MADTFATLMQSIPPAQITTAEGLRDDKTTNIAALDEQLAQLNALITINTENQALYLSTHGAAVNAAIAEAEALRDALDISAPGNAPHLIDYTGAVVATVTGNFPTPGTPTASDNVYDFAIYHVVLFIPVTDFNGPTQGPSNATLVANQGRVALMYDNIYNQFHGTSKLLVSLGNTVTITTSERTSVGTTADLYAAVYP